MVENHPSPSEPHGAAHRLVLSVEAPALDGHGLHIVRIVEQTHRGEGFSKTGDSWAASNGFTLGSVCLPAFAPGAAKDTLFVRGS